MREEWDEIGEGISELAEEFAVTTGHWTVVGELGDCTDWEYIVPTLPTPPNPTITLLGRARVPQPDG